VLEGMRYRTINGGEKKRRDEEKLLRGFMNPSTQEKVEERGGNLANV